MKRIWITWENQRRNIALSDEFNANLYVISYEDNRIIRYIKSIIATLIVLFKEKPKIVFFQNPSIILSLLIIMLKNLFNFKAVMDAHNAGIMPFEGKSIILNQISLIIQKNSDLIIVTNNYIKEFVIPNNLNTVTLPDRIPHIPKKKCESNLIGEFNILFVCTFSEDEPYLEVFKAAEKLEKRVAVYVSGNYNKLNALPSELENLILLGYIPDDDYFQMLYAVDAVMVLTERENCLVCGAYEAISAEKPMILSDKLIIKEYFRKGSIYVNNERDSILYAIKQIEKNKSSLTSEVIEFKKKIYEDWIETKLIVENSIRTICGQ